MAEFRFQVLGQLSVSVDGVALPIGGPKQRALLASLLLTPNRPVPIGRLTDLMWDEPPRSATANLRTYATGLRKVVRSRLVALAGGYELTLNPGESDLECFTEFVGVARTRYRAGELETARRLLVEALDLWTGRSGDDISVGSPIHRLVEHLNESRMLAVEELAAVRLDLGQEQDVVADLRVELSEHRTRERMWAQLMLGLYRLGDVAGALHAFHQAAEALDEELGMQPGEELRLLQRAILDRDATLDVSGQPVTVAGLTPFQLPMDARILVGRDREIQQILAECQAGGHGTVPTIVAVDGPGGVGKSALAVHAGHLLSADYPDGQLYLDLHGAAVGLQPSRPQHALGAMIRSLDGNATVTGDLAEDSAQYRSLAAGRRLLIVLDNAIDSEQVLPLLPATPGSTVLVTSRRRLSTLDAALHLHLDVLSDQDGVELLARLGCVRGEPAAAAAIARMCGGLPLALRVAAARLAKRPDWTVADLAQRLAGNRRRLDELGVDNLDVRASFAVTYDNLVASTAPTDVQATMIYRLMGVLQVPAYDTNLLAALADTTPAEVDAVLQRLVDLQLISTVDQGYRMHDLMRLFAIEHAEQELPDEVRTAALGRAFWYLGHGARRAISHLRGGPREIELGPDPRRHAVPLNFDSRRAAQAWLTTRRAVLLAAIQQSGSTVPQAGMVIIEALSGDLERQGHWHEIAELNHRLAGLALSVGDLRGQARAARVIATVHQRLGRPYEAMRQLRRSIELYRQLGDPRGLAIVLNVKGIFLTEASRWIAAEACLSQALLLIEQCDEPAWTGVILNALGMHHRERRQFDQATGFLERALGLRRECDDVLGEMYTLMQLARVDASLHRTDAALGRLDLVVELAGDVGADDFELQARRLRFVVLSAAQRTADAEIELARAADVCRRVPDELASEKLRELVRGVTRRDAATMHVELFSQRTPA
jgi:DNA-binding SARP family transcriptional activator/tetratricopeptide (TPR) repeat protein